MKKYILNTFSSPVAGMEDAYEEWYNNVHLADLLKIEGIKSAQRFSPIQAPGANPGKFLAVYEIETDHIAQFLEEMKNEGQHMQLSDALDLSSLSTQLYEVHTEKIVKG